jgi:NAD(P)-dependent dehydrogenase (short-subunit alcohol dehydrogenase family)
VFGYREGNRLIVSLSYITASVRSTPTKIRELSRYVARPLKRFAKRSSSDGGLPDAIVSNDAYPITRNEIEHIPIEDLRSMFEAVVMFPIQLTQRFIPKMKARRSGAFVFVTSAREARPEPGFAVPTTLRAATTAFAKPCQRRRRLSALQANVVAPNYLYSEMYYPKARFVDATERNEQPREPFLARVLRSQPRLSVLLVDLLASVRWK